MSFFLWERMVLPLCVDLEIQTTHRLGAPDPVSVLFLACGLLICRAVRTSTTKFGFLQARFSRWLSSMPTASDRAIGHSISEI